MTLWKEQNGIRPEWQLIWMPLIRMTLTLMTHIRMTYRNANHYKNDLNITIKQFYQNSNVQIRNSLYLVKMMQILVHH